MRKLLIVVVALGAVAAGCVAPPPGDEPTRVLLQRPTEPAGSHWIGQFGADPIGAATVHLSSAGLALGVDLCVVVEVLDAIPIDGGEVLHEEVSCTATNIVPGDFSVVIDPVLTDYDAAGLGPLEGRWMTISSGLLLEAGQQIPLTAVRSIQVGGITLGPACQWRSPLYPC